MVRMVDMLEQSLMTDLYIDQLIALPSALHSLQLAEQAAGGRTEVESVYGEMSPIFLISHMASVRVTKVII